MPRRISFDCVLLQRMKEPYRSTVMARNDLSGDDVEKLAAESELSFNEFPTASIDRYRTVLGNELWTTQSDEQTIDHAFALTLWPDLIWMISTDEFGRPVDMRFARKVPSPLMLGNREPEPGDWTLLDLKSASRNSEIVDGWDEHQVHRFVIDDECHDGEFVFGLLQSWKPAA
jgi:hypothetical protein